MVEQGAIDDNPFVSLNLKQRGQSKKHWQRFKKDDLYKLFAHKWDSKMRLLLSILVTTGMRLEEAVALTWDRYNDTDDEGIRYFSLLSTGFEEVDVKTESSKRYVLLHPDLILPPVQRSGRLFTYSRGKAGNKINPILKVMFNNPLKRAHSFRRTFKILYHDEGVDEKAIDALVSHVEGDASRKAYAGVGVPRRFEMLCRVKHPYLKQPSHNVHPK